MRTQDLREFLQGVHKHSGMYLVTSTFAEACAFLVGYDLAAHGGLLAGFRQWLVVRTHGRSNHAFPSLVLKYVAPHATFGTLTPEQDRLALDGLFNLLDEFISLGELEKRVATASQLEAHRRVSRWHCLCCGFAALTDPPPGSNLICPVCFWQDDLVDATAFSRPLGPNKVSLKTARRNFLEFGASEKQLLRYVRTPTEAEHPRLPLEQLDPAADLMLRTKFPKGSHRPNVDKIHGDLAYWSVFVNCIVFPLKMGLPAIDSGLDVGQGLADVKAKLEKAIADPEQPEKELLQEYLTYCDLVIEVWRTANPRWEAMEWVLQPRGAA